MMVAVERSGVAQERQRSRPTSVSANKYHVFANGRQVGPFEFDHVVGMARRGEISRTDLVWTPGMDQWTPASKVPGIFPPTLFKSKDGPAVQGIPTPPDSRKKKRKSYFHRHWTGRASLAQAVFAHCILAWVVYVGISYLLLDMAISAFDLEERELLAVELPLYAFGWILYVWGIVGTWRSARRHVMKTGERIWPAMAQAYVVYTVIFQLLLYAGLATLFVISRL